ncbi:hypothetical protein ACOMHN_022944 [Nucella lapillus]
MSEKESLIRGSEESDHPRGRYQSLSSLFTPAGRSHHLPFTTNITTTTTTTTTSMTQQQHHGTDIESSGGQTSAQPSSPSPSSTSLPPPAPPPSSSCRQRILGVLRSNLLVFLLILALILGILLSMLLRQRPEPYSERELMYLKYPGELLMNMLKLLILPLIVSSLISGLTSLDTRSSGKLGFRAVVYYMTTTLMAVVLGIVMVLSIQPGKRGDQPKGDGTFRKLEPVDTFLDLLR